MNYEITALLPEINKLQVRYIDSQDREVFLSFVVDSFDEQDLHAAAQEGISRAITYFKNIEQKGAINVTPESLSNKTGETNITDYAPTPPPTYDPFNEYLNKSMVENNGVLTEEWEIKPLSAEQKDELRLGWRAQAGVSMRQARLALIQRGLLNQVDASIAAMPEPDRAIVEIEWEYASSIERNSPWVIQLGSALGLDEEGLDELFKAAAEL